MPKRIVLLRHVAPQVDPATDPRDWTLSPAGRAAAAGLRSRLPAEARFVASDEPKAIDTLRATHSMVLTAWLTSIGFVRPGEEAAAFWDRLARPDLIEAADPRSLPMPSGSHGSRLTSANAAARYDLPRMSRPGGRGPSNRGEESPDSEGQGGG